MNNREFNLQEEAEYVLGMVELYSSDSEIKSMLKMKGLNDEDVDSVVAYIQKEGFKKRIKQAEKIIIIGFSIMIVLGGIWVYFFKSSNIYNPDDDYLSRFNSRMIVKFFFYGFLFGVGQTGYGIYRYIVYSIKLYKNK